MPKQYKWISLLSRMPWIWSIVGSLVLWISIGIMSSRLTIGTLITNVTLATFLIIIGLGQMVAITGGSGGIDLSIPYVVTFSAFLSIGITHGASGITPFLYGLLSTLTVGLLVGLINGLIIVLLNIPPIITTMATGFIIDSVGIVYAHGFSSSLPSPLLTSILSVKIAGLPFLIPFALLVSLLIGLVVRHTTYGRSLEAVGQSPHAAAYSGISTSRVRITSFVLSGILAALGGTLLAAYNGGAFLSMGDPYLLTSIGAVVIGGSLISGGRSTVVGTIGGAIFLTLIVTAMELTKMSIGLQDVLRGLVIIFVLIISRAFVT